MTRVGLFVISRILESQMEERLVDVGSYLCLFLEEVVLKMDLRTSLGFLLNRFTKAKPHLL